MKAISIVVPTLNESENIPILVSRISKSFRNSAVRYEIIFVDDHSIDGTIEVIGSLIKDYPISLYLKQGPRGKAYSLLQGFDLAKFDIICMIDADLQYPPEAILPMYQLLENSDIDVALTERIDENDTSKLRKFSSQVFHLIFTKLLFGFDYDTQSGLKVFRRTVIRSVTLNPTPWSFDLEFIVRALENNFKILSYKIPFSKRLNGDVKVQLLKVAYELATASLKLRFDSSPQKIKQAYRMNLRLAERSVTAFVTIIIGLSIMAAAVYMSASTSIASASQIMHQDASPWPNSNSLISVSTNLIGPAKPMEKPTVKPTEISFDNVTYPKQSAATSYGYTDANTGTDTNISSAISNNTLKIGISTLGSVMMFALAVFVALRLLNRIRQPSYVPGTSR